MRFPLAICLARSKALFEKLGGASITNHFLLILQKLARIGKNLKCYLYLCSKKRSHRPLDSKSSMASTPSFD